MKPVDIKIENKINELLCCLDKDCQYIEEMFSQLNELRKLIIKRDDAALGKMLETVKTKSLVKTLRPNPALYATFSKCNCWSK